MATTRTIFQLAPELLNLTEDDLAALDLSLSWCISNWEKNSEGPLNKRAPFASSQEYMAAKELLTQVLKLKLEASER